MSDKRKKADRFIPLAPCKKGGYHGLRIQETDEGVKIGSGRLVPGEDTGEEGTEYTTLQQSADGVGYDVTVIRGARSSTGAVSHAYRKNYDGIFGKKTRHPKEDLN